MQEMYYIVLLCMIHLYWIDCPTIAYYVYTSWVSISSRFRDGVLTLMTGTLATTLQCELELILCGLSEDIVQDSQER